PLPSPLLSPSLSLLFWMSFSRHPRSPSMGIYSPVRNGGVNGGHSTIPHSHSTDVSVSSWPHPSPSTLNRSGMEYGRQSISNRAYPQPRGVRVMREEMEFERLTYGGEEEKEENHREYIQETDILGDDSSSGGEERRKDNGERREGRELRSNT
ncbi:hypothetical protein PENTCL1PPCAC_6720, partial [Pristionchus entomophagus]